MKSPDTKGWRISLLTAAVALSACDIPTDTPKLEQEWIVPLAETSIEVVEFLPDRVGLTTDESAFTVQVDPISFQDSLGALCERCQDLDGLTVPKPEFSGEFHESITLPEDVESAQVEEGKVSVVARNRFGFDPLRPPGGATGSFTLAIHDGGPTGPTLDEVVVDGEDTSFGPGAELSRDLEYSGPVGSTLTVTVHVDSPAGGPEPGNWVPIHLSDEIEVTVTPETIEASSAQISVAGEVFDLGVTGLNVEDVSKEMADRFQSGTLQLEIVNPWSVGAILNLTIIGPTMANPVILIAQVPASPTSVVEVPLSQAELRSFLGEPNVVLTGQGTVSQDAGSVTVTPGQTMAVNCRLDLVLLIG
jgi:hypothetical protein